MGKENSGFYLVVGLILAATIFISYLQEGTGFAISLRSSRHKVIYLDPQSTTQPTIQSTRGQGAGQKTQGDFQEKSKYRFLIPDPYEHQKALLENSFITPLSGNSFLQSQTLASPSPIPLYPYSYRGERQGDWFGMGVVDLGDLFKNGGVNLFALDASNSQRYLIDARNGKTVWKKQDMSPPSDPRALCETNIVSTVAKLGRTSTPSLDMTIALGAPYWSHDYGNGIANNIGHVCIIDPKTGNYLNSVEGNFGGDRFGLSIISLQDRRTSQPVTYVGIGSPYFGVAGRFDIFKLDDITSKKYGNFYALETQTILGDRTNGGIFGRAAANIGDINNDGIDDFIVSDPVYLGYGAFTIYDSRITLSGSVFWGYSLLVDWHYYTGGSPGFGLSLTAVKDALSGDTFIFTGNPLASYGPNNVGIVNVFSLNKLLRGYPELTYVIGQAQDSFFGNTLASVGDVDGDGQEDVAVSAPTYDPISSSKRGAIYVYSGSLSGFNPKPLLLKLAREPYSRLGYGLSSVSGGSDINKDGKADVFAGGHGAYQGTGEILVFGQGFNSP